MSDVSVEAQHISEKNVYERDKGSIMRGWILLNSLLCILNWLILCKVMILLVYVGLENVEGIDIIGFPCKFQTFFIKFDFEYAQN